MEMSAIVRSYVATGEAKKALLLLLEYTTNNKEELIDYIVMIKGRLNKLEEAETLGTISPSEASVERAKINQAILEVLENTRSSSGAPVASGAGAKRSVFKSNYWLYGIGGLVIILLLAFFAQSIFSGTSDSVVESFPNINKGYDYEVISSAGFLTLRSRPVSLAEQEEIVNSGGADPYYQCRIMAREMVNVIQINRDKNNVKVRGKCENGTIREGWVKLYHFNQPTLDWEAQ